MKLICLFISCFLLVQAEVYLHNPRGSNNHGCERDNNRRSSTRLFNSQNHYRGGYHCPNAVPFACYQLPTEAARRTCNELNADQNYDDISGPGIMDETGLLHEKATKTPRLYFYEGSQLQIEWTNQNGCGDNPRVRCDVILQYACEDTLADDCGEPGSGKKCYPRDGRPFTNSDEGRGTVSYSSIFQYDGVSTYSRRDRDKEVVTTIPTSTDFNVQSDPRFSRHEGLSYFAKCRYRERNKGLWTADIGLRNDATGTRQNPGGGRYGLECPEERDYYPYWAPSPWKDIAILTDYRLDQCQGLAGESQNVKDKYECVCPSCLTQNNLIPNNAQGCTTVGGTWTRVPAFGIAAPLCLYPPATRENQLGNPIGGGKSASSFNWTIPNNIGKQCFLRIRYNITSGDPTSDNAGPVSVVGTSRNNNLNSPILDSRGSKNGEMKSYLPIDELIQTNPAARLGVNLDTGYFGRVFQDRSYSFEIRPRPVSGECAGKNIYNLNVRGKRGNIVQVFPAVEYDFVPSEMYITDQDCVHVQWTGTDYGEAQNANNAYGGPPDPQNLNDGRADRHNMVQLTDVMDYQPVNSFDYSWFMFTTTRQRKINLAFINQPIDNTLVCMTIESIVALSAQADENDIALYRDRGNNFLDDNDDRERYWKNCGKLSGALTPYFDGGLLFAGYPGDYAYLSTRGNSFSNRNQAGIIHIRSVIIANGSIVPIILGGVGLLGLAGFGFGYYRRRSSSSMAAGNVNENGVFLPQDNKSNAQVAAVVTTKTASKRARPVASTSAGNFDSQTTATALFNHQPSEAGELEFRKGDIITVLRKDDSGWWEGRTPDGKKGIFPANYVSS